MKYLPAVRRDGAQVIVAVTHLSFAEDRKLALTLPQIDVIVGGHEHYPITAAEGRTFISKAGSDAKFAARIDISKRPGPAAIVEKFFELVPVTDAIPDDAKTKAVADSYEARLGKELDTVVGTSTAISMSGAPESAPISSIRRRSSRSRGNSRAMAATTGGIHTAPAEAK